MTKSNLIQTVFCLVIIFISLILANTFDFFMPMGIQFLLIALATLLFALIAKKLLQKNSLDEREQILELNSYKRAYIVSNTTLLGVIFYQSLNHSYNLVLVLVLSISLLSKVTISILKK